VKREFIQVGSAHSFELVDDGFRVPLARGYADTPRESHPTALWYIAISPVGGDLGMDKSLLWSALTLPALTAEQNEAIVSKAVGATMDPGMVLVRLEIIE